MLFKGAAEMRWILKTAFKSGVAYSLIPVDQQESGMLQSFFQQPFAGRVVKLFLKVAFKGREAAIA